MIMCSSISWPQFIVTLFVLLLLYYGYVGVNYYRTDWWYRIRTKKGSEPTVALAVAVGSGEANPLLPQVHDLVDEIRAFLQATGNAADKAALLAKLRLLLQKYPLLNGTSFQPSINQFIAGESKNHCAVEVGEEDLQALWA
jgi:hypothetical protein